MAKGLAAWACVRAIVTVILIALLARDVFQRNGHTAVPGCTGSGKMVGITAWTKRFYLPIASTVKALVVWFVPRQL